MHGTNDEAHAIASASPARIRHLLDTARQRRMRALFVTIWYIWSGMASASASGFRTAAEDGALLACVAISDDRARLRCFDEEMAAVTRSTRRPALPAAAPGQTPRPDPLSAATPPVATAETAVVRAGPRIRVALGYGFGVGDHTGSFRIPTGSVSLQSAVGGSGALASGQLWIDRWIGENWSIGVEYAAFRNQGRFTVALPQGLSILTDPVQAGAQAKLRADFGFLNVEYRMASGAVHPFVGGGFGIGYGHASAGYYFQNAFLGDVAQVVAVGKPIAGLQLFSGVEFDLTHGLFVSVMPKVIVVDGHPIGLDQRYLEFGVDGMVGWRF
jgi:hypothetical protein